MPASLVPSRTEPSGSISMSTMVVSAASDKPRGPPSSERALISSSDGLMIPRLCAIPTSIAPVSSSARVIGKSLRNSSSALRSTRTTFPELSTMAVPPPKVDATIFPDE